MANPMLFLLLDVRQAVRQCGARPGFTLAVLIVLAVGIGANATTFILARGLLLRPLPYPDSEAIVSVGRVLRERPGGLPPSLSNTELRRLWDDAQSFEQLAAYTPLRVLLNGPDGPVNLFAAAVTPSLFPLLRTTPRVGRFFTAADAVDGTHGSVLLSHHAWTNRFGADPGILGAAVELNGEPYTVVGVFPDGFDFPHPLVELWTPLVVPPYEAPVDEGLGIRRALAGIGRLRPGLTPQQAAAEVRTLFDRAVDGRFVPPGLDLETRVTSLREERGTAVPAGAADAHRGNRARIADHLYQRGWSAACARRGAAAGAGPPRGARRRARPDRPPTADGECRPQHGRRCCGPRRGRRARPHRARAGPA